MPSRSCSIGKAIPLLPLILCLAQLGIARASAAELRSISVSLEDGRYRLSSVTRFRAARDEVYAVLTDYDLYKKFTSAIIDSENVGPDEQGRPRFYTRMEGCILFVCRTFVRKGYLLLNPTHDIVAITDPEQSDFKFSRERWQLSNDEGGTILVYEFEMEPRFWIPPIIGPYLIKRSLKQGSVRAVDRIEALARGREPTF